MIDNKKEILYMLLTYFVSMYVHEIGHMFISIVYNKFVRLQGSMLLETIYRESEDHQHEEILLYGIVVGYIVIMIYGYYYYKTYKKIDNYIYLSITYLFGCVYDIIELLKIKNII